MRKKKMKNSLIVAMCAIFALSMGSAVLVGTPKVKAETAVSAIYKLDFSDAANRGKNSGSNTDLADANVVIGADANNGVTFVENDIKGNTSINLTSKGHLVNLVEIPGAVLNSESVTIAGWFKYNNTAPGWSRMIEINDNSEPRSYISVMPYAPNYYNGIHVNTVIDGVLVTGINNVDNMLFEGGDATAAANSPASAGILPVYDAWTHYAYELTPTAFNIYQNGVLMATKAGDFSANKFYADNARIYLGATNCDGTADFSGAYADIRVYNGALSASEIKSEYSLEYGDFLTTSYDFENGMKEDVRGYDATAINTATTGYDEAKKSNVLVLDGGQGTAGDTWTHTSLELPQTVLHGHNQITISVDVFVDSDCSNYARIFDFSPRGSQSFSLGAKWGNATTLLLKFTTNEGQRDQTIPVNTEFNSWVNMTMTADGKTAAFYIDGVLVGKSENFEYKNSMFWEQCGSKAIGAVRFWGDRAFVGKMDNLKIYSTALTEKEVMMSLGITSIEDDATAVAQEKEKLTLTYTDETAKLDFPTLLGEGVRASWVSSNTDVVTAEGIVLSPMSNTNVTITATLTRGNVTDTKSFEITVKAKPLPDLSIFEGTEIDNVKFEEGSYYAQLMKTNLDYMFSLDRDRLLYNYRDVAGLDTLGAEPYGAWIAPSSNGGGQFEAHYIVALAKASKSMPNYSHNGETVLDRLTYMMTELKKCQDAFKGTADEGYFGALILENFDSLVTGNVQLSNGTSRWVPWYFYHKNLEALLDVYNYAASEEMRSLAGEMLAPAATWVYNRMSPLDDATRAKVLTVEYGGMAEVLYQIYAVTRDVKHFQAAGYFEEKAFLDNIYKNVDLLNGLHSNTTIPKFLGCAAAYEVTGNEYYKTIVINAFEMIMTRTYANGSTSRGEFWQEAGHLETANDTSETCCSYNMLKLADYLYRWTGEKKYVDYFENVYTNHILASMAPDTGLKTYLTNSAFGSYKVYHTVDNSFWCCACTGMESFAKLAYGIYYTDENTLKVNMFLPSEVSFNGLKVVQSGDFFTEQKTTLTVSGSGSAVISLRMPSWAEQGAIVKINGEVQQITAENGYYNLSRAWVDGDKIEYEVPFTLRLDTLQGHENYKALMYGPLMFVADLGSDDVQDVQGSQLTFGTSYTGDIVDKIVLDGALEDAAKITYNGREITLTLSTLNQGELVFRPFNQLFHSRYGMYFHYYDTLAEAEADYTVIGNEKNNAFDSADGLVEFDEYSSANAGVKVENGMLVTPSSGESKLILKGTYGVPYVLEGTFAPISANGAINGGFYLFASNPANGQDKIKAYNVQIEKTAGSATYVLNIFKFDNGYIGSVKSVTLPFPESGEIQLHILVKADTISVFVGSSKNASLSLAVDSSFITETTAAIGIRSQVSSFKFDNFRLISAELAVGKELLDTAIEIANGFVESDWTSGTFEVLKKALENANVISADENATQEQVNKANEELRSAIDGIEKKADAEELKNAVKMISALDYRNYTVESWSALQAVCEEIATYDLSDISEGQDKELKDKLMKALFGLKGADITAYLNEAITAAEALVEEEYTVESWAKFKLVLDEVKALTPANAVEADDAVEKLLKAQLDLVIRDDVVRCNASLSGLASNGVILMIGAIAIALNKKRK